MDRGTEQAIARELEARGLLGRAQLDEAQEIQAKLAKIDVQEDLLDILVRKGMLAADQAAELRVNYGPGRARTGNTKDAIEGYELLAQLGKGGMGVVYKALQRSMNRVVALKVLLPMYAKDASFRDRFFRESRTAGRLNHPNVVAAYDSGISNGHCYLAMEFVEGESVAQILKRRGKLSELEALQVGICVCKALEHAQEHGLVHRDVKPENILVTRQGEVKLSDLGLAKEIQPGKDSSLTQEGAVVGSPWYMAPEQARGESELDIRTDLYALGATIFHMLAGVPPFDGPTPIAIMAMHITDAPPALGSLNAEVSPATQALVTRLLAKKAADRPAGPAEVRSELSRIQKTISGEFNVRDFVGGGEDPGATKVLPKAGKRAASGRAAAAPRPKPAPAPPAKAPSGKQDKAGSAKLAKPGSGRRKRTAADGRASKPGGARRLAFALLGLAVVLAAGAAVALVVKPLEEWKVLIREKTGWDLGGGPGGGTQTPGGDPGGAPGTGAGPRKPAAPGDLELEERRRRGQAAVDELEAMTKAVPSDRAAIRAKLAELVGSFGEGTLWAERGHAIVEAWEKDRRERADKALAALKAGAEALASQNRWREAAASAAGFPAELEETPAAEALGKLREELRARGRQAAQDAAAAADRMLASGDPEAATKLLQPLIDGGFPEDRAVLDAAAGRIMAWREAHTKEAETARQEALAAYAGFIDELRRAASSGRIEEARNLALAARTDPRLAAVQELAEPWGRDFGLVAAVYEGAQDLLSGMAGRELSLQSREDREVRGRLVSAKAGSIELEVAQGARLELKLSGLSPAAVLDLFRTATPRGAGQEALREGLYALLVLGEPEPARELLGEQALAGERYAPLFESVRAEAAAARARRRERDAAALDAHAAAFKEAKRWASMAAALETLREDCGDTAWWAANHARVEADLALARKRGGPRPEPAWRDPFGPADFARAERLSGTWEELEGGLRCSGPGSMLLFEPAVPEPRFRFRLRVPAGRDLQDGFAVVRSESSRRTWCLGARAGRRAWVLGEGFASELSRFDPALAPDRDYDCVVVVGDGRMVLSVEGGPTLMVPMPDDAGPFRVGFAAQMSSAVFKEARLAEGE